MERPPTFFCDGMLGHVTRWLRLMGYDAEYAGSNLTDDEILARLAGTDRILATRDIHLSQKAARREIAVVRLSGGPLMEELEDLLTRLKVSPDPARWLSRCTECNAELVDTTLEEVIDRIPPDLAEFAREFTRCPQCQHVYWDGTHVQRIEQQLGEIVRRMESVSKA